MNIVSIINNKKNKIELSEIEINYFIKEFTINKTIPDYQAAALLMAFNINGLTDDEIFFLTKYMIEYSNKLEFKKTNLIIDKHSSGGVGDKVSLIITPILRSLGFSIAKLSGRGLGLTGGTIDKLDSIKANTFYKNNNDIMKQFNENQIIFLQQTDDIVPADKIIYALRDVTGTVDTDGLIISSILSKKFIINSDYIFLDIKIGDGALIKTKEHGNIIANKMQIVAKKFNRNLKIKLTDMNKPLGRAIGNKLEIIETIEFLKNKNVAIDLKDNIYEFIISVLLETKITSSKEEAIKMIDNVLNDNSAYLEFTKWINSISEVNVDKIIDDYNPKNSIEIKSSKSGTIDYNDIEKIALVNLELGAGRKNKDSKIDFDAGIYLNKKSGNKVEKNDIIATLYSDKIISENLIEIFNNSYEIK